MRHPTIPKFPNIGFRHGGGGGTIPAPVNTVAPAISGTLTDGETVSLPTGTWTPTPDEFERAWTEDGLFVSSASTLDLTGTAGADVQATVRARLAGGTWSGWVAATGGGVVAPSGIPPTDYTITSDADFTALKALGGATLSGKSVLIDGNLGVMTFGTLSMASPLTFYMTPGRTVEGVTFAGDVSRCDFHGVFFQGQGWNGGQIGRVSSGAQGQHTFYDCTFRHGYTAALLDTPIDNQASIPEIQKYETTGTATTTSGRIAVHAWHDDGVDGGWLTVVNTGAQTIYVAIGDGTVTANTGITNTSTTRIIAAGDSYKFDGFSASAHPTHVAVITASGTSGVTVRMEQGMACFQKNGFTDAGGISYPDGGLQFIGCTFQDLNNGSYVKNGLIMDCLFERVYQDCAASGTDGVAVLRNTAFIGWATSSHAQNPHGDFFQMQSGGTQTRVNGLVAGNTLIPAYDKSDAIQGTLISDNDIDPSYDNWAFVGNSYVGCVNHGITNGETLWPCKNNFVVANTIISRVTDITLNGPIQMVTGSYYSYLAMNIHGDSSLGTNVIVSTANLQLKDVVGSRYAVFPDFDDLLTATSRAQVRAALTPAGVGVGLGQDVDAIDWVTDNPDLVVKWANLPSGAGWKFTATVTPGSVQTTGLAPILNRKTGQTVVPGSGVEWRSTQSDGTTEVQAWTTSSGTIEPGEMIQIRFTATSSPSTTDTKTITLNGIAETVSYTTANTVPSVYATVGSGSPNTYFRDTVNLSSGTTRLIGKAKIYMPSAPGAAFALFGQAATAWKFEISTSRQISINIKDSAQVSVFGGSKTLLDSLGAAVVLPTADWVDIIFDTDHTAQTVTVTINGVTHPSLAFTTPGTGTHRNGSALLIGSEASAGTVLWPSGTRFADLSVERNGSVYKTIANGATAANADAWKLGANAT